MTTEIDTTNAEDVFDDHDNVSLELVYEAIRIAQLPKYEVAGFVDGDKEV